MKKTDPWNALTPGIAKRVDSKGKCDFFWITAEQGAPSLMLRLDDGQEEINPLPKLKGLVVGYRVFSGRNALVLSLNEISQIDIFEVLCRNVVEAGEKANSPDHALKRAIERTRRWHHLLRGGSAGGLSIEEQQGLIGELSVLRELVYTISAVAAVDAWTGPRGAAKDFELGNVCIEVKAKRNAARPFVQISSEDQLANVSGARLFLRVTDVVSVIKPQGKTLHDHVNNTANLFEPGTPAFEEWEAAIAETGYDKDHDYENRRWELSGSSDFEVQTSFPRITPPLVQGVERVRYCIALAACADFEIKGKLMDIVVKEMSDE